MPSSLELSDTKIYETQIRALLGTAAHLCKLVFSQIENALVPLALVHVKNQAEYRVRVYGLGVRGEGVGVKVCGGNH